MMLGPGEISEDLERVLATFKNKHALKSAIVRLHCTWKLGSRAAVAGRSNGIVLGVRKLY